jgi:hypothetical protein
VATDLTDMADDKQTLGWADLADGVLVVVTDDPAAVGLSEIVPATPVSALSPVHPWVQAGRRDPAPSRLWTSQNVATLYWSSLGELGRRIRAASYRRTPMQW